MQHRDITISRTEATAYKCDDQNQTSTNWYLIFISDEDDGEDKSSNLAHQENKLFLVKFSENKELTARKVQYK